MRPPIPITRLKLDFYTKTVNQGGYDSKIVEFPYPQDGQMYILKFERDDAGLTWVLKSEIVLIPDVTDDWF